ncbi:unnamed protein product [Nippostrongylus brasiliensis]|uniref:VWFA domain-containing protein n=1 Tax=Nippostrongylus brasiliensis TaxID=27835 RepID=A0A0N4YUU9_NIPBR|nr:unnamed protein product [Nippostrongylus brasiliensis]
MLVMLIFFSTAISSACVWPIADVLYIMDGTLGVDQFEFKKEISFISQTFSNMKISEQASLISVAQFTPMGRQEIGLGQVRSTTEARQALEKIAFSPCDVLSDRTRCNPRASINSLAGVALQSANRKWLPDVVVVISSAKYRIPETAHQLELQRQRQLTAAPPTASVLQAQPIVFPYMPPNSVLAQQSPNNGMASGEPFLGNQAGVTRAQTPKAKLVKEVSKGNDKLTSARVRRGIVPADDELLLRLDKLEETLAKRSTEAGPTELTSSSPEHLLNINPPNSITEEDSSDGATDDSGYNARGGHLPSNHPARNLPPIDLLLLVDSSSSIGISNFESVKANLADILEDVDISPGRSRVALIQYALQPSVVFDFDKYYSLKSVQRGVERMSYTGGATMLSKALSFAAGLLYREQNMKDMKKRKHKLMPTPRHDRLQVLET